MPHTSLENILIVRVEDFKTAVEKTRAEVRIDVDGVLRMEAQDFNFYGKEIKYHLDHESHNSLFSTTAPINYHPGE